MKLPWKVYNVDEIKNFGSGNYESRLLLDSYMGGEPCVNVNHGTVAAGGHTGSFREDGKTLFGPAHEKAEVYLGMSGSATCYLDGTPVQMKHGTLIYIPGGTEHYLVNNSKTEPFTLVTIWPDEKDNEAWVARKKAWGTTYKRADEE